jgi:hypothetical protein
VITETELIKILNESRLKWWIDSGTLLGLYRDNQFLPNDADIDLGILCRSGEEAVVENLIMRLASHNFRCVRFVWGNRKCYKYKLIPRDKFPYKLDVQVYSENGTIAVSPQVVKNTQNKTLLHCLQQLLLDWRKGNTVRPKRTVRGMLMYFSYRLARIFLLRKNTTIDVRDLCPKFYNMLKWVIPIHFLNQVGDDVLNGYNVPNNIEKYLAYRYGDWRIPVKQWNFTQDDGAIQTTSVEELDKIFA